MERRLLPSWAPSSRDVLMERVLAAARAHWQEIVEEQGFIFHSTDTPYWNEEAYYRFTHREVEVLEQATNELHTHCLDAAKHIIAERRYTELGIPSRAIPLIEASWKAEPPSVYGRFDLGF